MDNEYKKIYDSLKILDLSEYETKIWISILSKGIADPKEISNDTSVPRSRTYEVLDSLEKKGFIMLKLGKPKKYISIPPKKVIQLIKNKEKSSMEKEIKKVENFEEDVIESLEEIYKQRKKDNISTEKIVSITKNKTKQLENLKMLLKGAQKELKIFTEFEFLKDMFLLFKKNFEDLHKRDLDIKIITATNDSKQIDLIKEKLGFINVKVINKEINKGFIIVDGKEVNFTTLKNDRKQALWVNTSFFGKALSRLFDIAWNNGKLVSGIEIKEKSKSSQTEKIKA
ncbi:MAG: TrmB family transcriptional regulator [Candidatus Woesearchaeota archaeon]